MLKKQTTGGKRERISGITKLDDANLAGTKDSQRFFFFFSERKRKSKSNF